jgi:hypothetical protein
MKTAIALLGLLLTCSCATTEMDAKKDAGPPAPKWVSAENGRGVPSFARYERNSIKPVDGAYPHLEEPRNGLPTFRLYERGRRTFYDVDY